MPDALMARDNRPPLNSGGFPSLVQRIRTKLLDGYHRSMRHAHGVEAVGKETTALSNAIASFRESLKTGDFASLLVMPAPVAKVKPEPNRLALHARQFAVTRSSAGRP
jgi:hypothetical protein